MTSCNRLCPSVEGSAAPLITHRIGVDVCLDRQRGFFHKCHRCIYRGQAADWEPAQPPLAMRDAFAEEAAAIVGVKEVELPRPRESKKAPAKLRAPARAAERRNGAAAAKAAEA